LDRSDAAKTRNLVMTIRTRAGQIVSIHQRFAHLGKQRHNPFNSSPMSLAIQGRIVSRSCSLLMSEHPEVRRR